MSDLIAQRVANRFLTAHADLHKIEAATHRAGALLKTVEQQHGLWAKSMAVDDFHQAEQVHHKLMALIQSYQKEVDSAMGEFETWHHEQLEMRDEAEREIYAAT
jgi:hypothetical protein